MDRSTAETTARRTITTDRGDPWDGAAWVSYSEGVYYHCNCVLNDVFSSQDRPNRRHHHHATTTPATRLSTTRRRVTKFPRLNAIEITVRGATTVVSLKVLSPFRFLTQIVHQKIRLIHFDHFEICLPNQMFPVFKIPFF